MVLYKVKKTLRKIKNNKAPGIDNLTSGVIKHGGDESVTQITAIFNQILKTKKIPVEWKDS